MYIIITPSPNELLGAIGYMLLGAALVQIVLLVRWLVRVLRQNKRGA